MVTMDIRQIPEQPEIIPDDERVPEVDTRVKQRVTPFFNQEDVVRQRNQMALAAARRGRIAIGCLGTILLVALLIAWMGPDREAETRHLASEVLVEDGALPQHHKNMLPLLVDAFTKLQKRFNCTPEEVVEAGRTIQAYIRRKSPNTTLCQSIHVLADQLPANATSINGAASALIDIEEAVERERSR